MGVLSADGRCKVFDKDGNGYARSEAISAILLQKSKDSKRIYATVLHAKTNCDGYKVEHKKNDTKKWNILCCWFETRIIFINIQDSGITYPSGDAQIKLLQEFYQECEQVKPFELSFLEAHGTGKPFSQNLHIFRRLLMNFNRILKAAIWINSFIKFWFPGK